MKKPKIIWNKLATDQFARAIKYIHEDSPQNAFKEKTDLLFLVDSLIDYPEKYPPDKNKKIIVKVSSELLKNIGCESVILFQKMK